MESVCGSTILSTSKGLFAASSAAHNTRLVVGRKYLGRCNAVGCCFLLVGAAVLKAGELLTDPTAALVNPTGRYFLPVEIGVELGVGLLLLSGFYWRTMRWLVIVLFTTFAGHSLYLALNGEASCGSFGPLRMNPRWTFGLDFVVVLGLLISMSLKRRANCNVAELSEAWFTPKLASRHYVISGVMGVAAMCTACHFDTQVNKLPRRMGGSRRRGA